MSLTYGFYNSSNHDRMYNALQVSQLFDGLIQNGVYETIGGALMVRANAGMSVNVLPGRAWFDHTWTLNDAIYPLVVENADSIVSRIDAVVLEVDARRDIRANSIKIVKGTPSANDPQPPELIDEDEIHQHPLAYIFVEADATEITQSDITNLVGTYACPFVTGVVSAMSADWLYAQWEAQFQEFMHDAPVEFKSWEAIQRADFLEWFDNLQYVLDGDVAGHLQNEIDELKDLWPIENVPYTLRAELWGDDYTYSLEGDYPSARYNILNVNVPDNIDPTAFDQLMEAELYGYNTSNIIRGHGRYKPTVNIPVVLQVIKKGVISE